MAYLTSFFMSAFGLAYPASCHVFPQNLLGLKSKTINLS